MRAFRAPSRAVFLDRDDTLIAARSLPAPPPPANPGDVTDPALVQLLPGSSQACRDLRGAGYLLVVVSNQGVVARGGASTDTVRAVNARVEQLLARDSGEDDKAPVIDAFYFCPFHPQGNVPEFTREHPWRKPAPGMLLAAAADLSLDLSASWLVGDSERDVRAGVAAGLAPERCLLIGPDAPLPDLPAAAAAILGRAPTH